MLKEFIVAGVLISAAGGGALSVVSLSNTSDLEEKVADMRVEMIDVRQNTDSVYQLKRQIAAQKLEIEKLQLLASAFRPTTNPDGSFAIKATGIFEIPGVATAKKSAQLDEKIMKDMVARVERDVRSRLQPSTIYRAGDKDVMKEVLGEIRKDEENQRQQRRTERRNERLKERIASYTEKLNLTNGQADQLMEIYQKQSTARREFFTAMRSGEGSREEIREKMRTLQEETELEIQQILSPLQFAELEKLQEDERGNWGGRGRRGGRDR